MNTITILLTQPQIYAIIEILLLLLGAGIIGYVTAWLYYKSIYQRSINGLKLDIENLYNQNHSLIREKNYQQISIDEKEKENSTLIKELIEIKALQEKTVIENQNMWLKNNKTEQLLSENNKELLQISQQKKKLNYNSFGKATISEKDDLKMISGIGTFIEDKLNALDIYTFNQISKFTDEDIKLLDEVVEYFSGRIIRDEWVAQAKELIHDKERKNTLLKRIIDRKGHVYYDRIGIAHISEADDLTIISGIGGWIKEKLNILDIYTFRQISNFTIKDIQTVTEVIEYFPGRIERDEWIVQAKELVKIAGNKTELLNQINEKKGKLNYDRLGSAEKHQANNLTLIHGISSWIEERLNSLDIYTFKQISKFSIVDVLMVAEILDISSDRIVLEKWVSQANTLAN